MLTFKRKLDLTKAQESKIDKWVSTCRFLYNMCKEIQEAAYRNKGGYVHKYALSKQLTEIRSIKWINDVPRVALEDVIKRLDSAYMKFFKGGGYPHWAQKQTYNSLTINDAVLLKCNRVRVAKIGWLKMFTDSSIPGELKQITIKKEVTGYYAYFVTDAVKFIQNTDESQVIALDMGIARFYSDSKGGFAANPKHFKAYERQLRIENRSLARKKKRGKNWLKQSRRLALLHNKIANARRDFLHKESTKIAKANNLVILEDLKIRSMVKKNSLSKHILDCGWGMFRAMLEYKTTVVAINPKHTSQTCNSCGAIDAKSRVSQSEFVCTSCAEVSHADHNAALNILGKGITYIRERKAIA